MSNEVTIKSNNNYGIEPRLWDILSKNIYRDSKPDSIKMAYDYCVEKKIDPLKKFVHIVPRMGVDTIMEGIGLYRLQATQSGKYIGKAEPEFGSAIIKDFGDGDKVSYPEWCKITVRKLIEGRIAEFTALEYWVENYASISKVSKVPNVMWKKRPHGQLAKCTEAQALRQAFQEEVSAEPTFEEMEGKTFENFKDVTTSGTQLLSQKLDALLTAQKININNDAVAPIEDKPLENNLFRKEEESLLSTEDYLEQIKSLINKYNVPEEIIKKWHDHYKIDSLDQLSITSMIKLIEKIEGQYGNDGR